MTASACLTLAAIYFLVWCHRRTVWADLLFSLTSAAVAVYAVIELSMMRAETPANSAPRCAGSMFRPGYSSCRSSASFGSTCGPGGSGSPGAICALRTLALLLNFLVGQNLNYREVTALRHIPFLGESVSIGVGVSNPCMLVGQLSLLLWLVFSRTPRSPSGGGATGDRRWPQVAASCSSRWPGSCRPCWCSGR